MTFVAIGSWGGSVSSSLSCEGELDGTKGLIYDESLRHKISDPSGALKISLTRHGREVLATAIWAWRDYEGFTSLLAIKLRTIS